MKLDAIRKILMNARDKTVQQSKACYTCEKLDYFFRDCTQNKYKNKSKLYDRQDRSFAATKEDVTSVSRLNKAEVLINSHQV